MAAHKIEMYRAEDGWRFRAKARNGKIIGASEEGVKQRTYCERRALKQFPDTPVIEVDA